MASALTANTVTFSQLNVARQLETVQTTAFPASLAPIAQELARLAQDHAKCPSQKIPVIGIGGCPGIGKTIFTKVLSQELQKQGISSTTVLFDDWTNPAESRQKGYFDLEGIHTFFQNFMKSQQSIQKPTSAEFEDLYSTEVLDLSRVDIILFEGCFTLCGKDPMNYIQYCDKGIYLDAEDADISRWKRERPSTVQRTNEEFAEHMRNTFNAHREYIAPFKSQATWVVHKAPDHSYSL